MEKRNDMQTPKIRSMRQNYILIQNMLSNIRITVPLNNILSYSKIIKNGFPQGSVVAPLLFNVYSNDMPEILARKFTYADDIAVTTQHKHLKETGRLLITNLATLGNYYRKWGLKPKPNKSEVCAFHLSNRQANTEL